MKKMIILLLIVVCLVTTFSYADNQEAKEAQRTAQPHDPITKSYTLKYVDPEIVLKSLQPYLYNYSFDSRANMITVVIDREKIPQFETLLKQLDVEKRKIQIRVFTVIASQEGKSGDIANTDLQQVLTELQKVLSLKAFRLEGVSALSLTEGQGFRLLKLSSQPPLELRIKDVNIRGQKKGEREVGIEFELKHVGKINHPKDEQKWVSETLLQTETTIKENGYLVAGVSKIGNGDSLVLVINAEIK